MLPAVSLVQANHDGRCVQSFPGRIRDGAIMVTVLGLLPVCRLSR